mmetsp:Transcript_6450/g.9062  ORF Transcript_6450/g.9062 Transcript_6450/m.9062 type:complete len:305 (-) Transcript_6450:1492-2406(-)
MSDSFHQSPWHLSNLTCRAAFCDVMPSQGIGCCDSSRVRFASLENTEVASAANWTNGMILCRCSLSSGSSMGSISSASNHSLLIIYLLVLLILICASAIILRQIINVRAMREDYNGPPFELQNFSGTIDSSAGEESRQILHEYNLCTQRAKAALRTACSKDVDKSSLCPICIDYLGEISNAVVHPPNCRHCYHRACLTRWIDQVDICTVESARDVAAKRMLSCPVCALPIVPDVSSTHQPKNFFRIFLHRQLLRFISNRNMINTNATVTPMQPEENTPEPEVILTAGFQAHHSPAEDQQHDIEM